MGQEFHQILVCENILFQVSIKQKQFMVTPIAHNIWGAPTDNDEGGDKKSFASQWLRAGYNKIKREVISIDNKYKDDLYQISVIEKHLSDSANIHVSIVYTFYPKGDLHVEVETRIPESLPVLPKIGLTLKLENKYSKITWYGRVPHESYSDRKHSAFIGEYTGFIKDLGLENSY